MLSRLGIRHPHLHLRLGSVRVKQQCMNPASRCGPLVALLMSYLCCCRSVQPAVVAPAGAPPGPGQVVLDGRRLTVTWDDGDTFNWVEHGRRRRARLVGFNALESYGPVHQWGNWTAEELLAVAQEAGKVAAASGWHCQDTGDGGGYGRDAVKCPKLGQALVGQGLAHVFAVDSTADGALLAAQAEASVAGRGMWAKGVPEGIVTSLHSRSERWGQTETYDRVADIRTGRADKRMHSSTYETCQRVCRAGSCMLYIPHKNRYGNNKVRCSHRGETLPTSP